MERDLGVDKALNYKSPNFRKEFNEAVGYLDVYFDNVGGEILNIALARLKKNARMKKNLYSRNTFDGYPFPMGRRKSERG